MCMCMCMCMCMHMHMYPVEGVSREVRCGVSEGKPYFTYTSR